MPLSKDQILAVLPKLSQADLKALEAVIHSLLTKGGHDSPPTISGPLAWLTEALQATINGKLTTQGQAKAFAKNAPIALAFIEQAFKGRLTSRTKAIGLMRWLLSLLVADMQRMKIPVTRNTLCEGLARLPEAFERAYPGYIEAGMTYMVAKAALGESKMEKK